MNGDVLLQRGGEGYPPLLSSIQDAPEELHLRGRIGPCDAVAIVGSRRPTPYGRRMARLLAAGCAHNGIAVVSGLARGIDTEAHAAALDAGGITWAVLGSGLDRIYPAENTALAGRIVSSGGAILSEFPSETGPQSFHFPRRNRVVSGLSWGVVVVEGGPKSGALITARCALSQGREVFAVPGPADSPMSEGPLELLRQGALMARRTEDILAELPMLSSPNRGKDDFLSYNDTPLPGGGPALGTEEGRIIDLLACGTLSLEELAEETGWPASRLVRSLTELESRGRILAVPGQRYARR
jgi:DNA processing protein